MAFRVRAKSIDSKFDEKLQQNLLDSARLKVKENEIYNNKGGVH